MDQMLSLSADIFKFEFEFYHSIYLSESKDWLLDRSKWT